MNINLTNIITFDKPAKIRKNLIKKWYGKIDIPSLYVSSYHPGSNKVNVVSDGLAQNPN